MITKPTEIRHGMVISEMNWLLLLDTVLAIVSVVFTVCLFARYY